MTSPSPKDGKMDGGWTPGPWKAVALGGSSTVIVPTRPRRNDNRIPAYAYDPNKGFCVGYPFIPDRDLAEVRLDFVNFSHADARLIAAAPCLNEGGKNLANEVAGLKAFEPEIRAVIGNTNWNVLMQREEELRAAIHRARSTDGGGE